MAPERSEVEEAHRKYLATRSRVEEGDLPWSALAEHFTADAVYIDPAWGRIEGRDAILEFMDASMAGLDDWEFPEQWTMIEGDRVVSSWWNRLPGSRDDGTPYQALGISVMRYAGWGRFDYSHDLLNMAEVHELIADSGWSPSGGFNMPPGRPERDTSYPGRG
mgnify:CR=1 FL=1